MEKIFSQELTTNYKNSTIKDVISHISSMDPNTLESIGVNKYLDFVYENSKWVLPELEIGKMERTKGEQVIDKKTSILNGIEHKFQVSFYIPLLGQMSKLNKTNIIAYRSADQFKELKNVFYAEEEIIIQMEIPKSSTQEEIQRKKDSLINNVVQCYGMLKGEIDSFNKLLKQSIKDKLEEIQQKFSHERAIVNNLEIPLRKKKDSTISVRPVLRQKITIDKSNVKLEPSITDETYHEILSLINDCLKNFERMPSLFKDRDENHLRDMILFVIDPNFEMGSVSGETFNKKGKTDIMLKYNSTNIFVAECKFWYGVPGLTETINQLLSYLTWRDSKAAIIFFVNRKSLSKVESDIKNNISYHSNFIRFEDNLTEGVYKYQFHLSGDNQKIIWITIMLCHTYA